MLTKKANQILIFGILSIAFSWLPAAGLILAVITFILFLSDKTVKSSMKAEIGRTLAIIGLIVNLIAIA